MKRTTTRRRKEAVAFIHENRRLFPFAGLFLLGVLCGVLVYVAAARPAEEWTGLLQVSTAIDSWQSGLSALWGSVLSVVVLLGALFLLGMWSCGAPFILLVPLFYGLGLGLTEAYYYSLGGRGFPAVALVVMPHGLLCAAVLVTAAVESMRLSTKLSRQLLPTASGGGLWSAFRLYCLRFLLFLLATLFVGLLDILFRMLFGRFLP